MSTSSQYTMWTYAMDTKEQIREHIELAMGMGKREEIAAWVRSVDEARRDVGCNMTWVKSLGQWCEELPRASAEESAEESAERSAEKSVGESVKESVEKGDKPSDESNDEDSESEEDDVTEPETVDGMTWAPERNLARKLVDLAIHHSMQRVMRKKRRDMHLPSLTDSCPEKILRNSMQPIMPGSYFIKDVPVTRRIKPELEIMRDKAWELLSDWVDRAEASRGLMRS